MKNPLLALMLSMAMLSIAGCSANRSRSYIAMDAEFKKAPLVRPFYDNYWLLLEDLTFETTRLKDGKYFKITVPAGFVTDLASIPVPLNAIYDKTGRYSSAGILHDYLYWTQFCDRKESDRLIKEGLKATGAGYLTRNTIKYGVYLFGWAAWNKNKKEKKKGEERFVPDGKREFPSNTPWSEFRKTLGNDILPPWENPELKIQVQEGCKVFDCEQ